MLLAVQHKNAPLLDHKKKTKFNIQTTFVVDNNVSYFAEVDSSTENEAEIASSAHERNKRSSGDEAPMTAENMISADADSDAASVNRPMRIKRDLSDYLYNRRWINDGKITCSVIVVL